MKTAIVPNVYNAGEHLTNGRADALRTTVSEACAPALHPLTPLLAPRSIALVGASEVLNTPGNDMLHELRVSRYKGKIWPVNPKYDEIEDRPCYPSLSALPLVPELAVLAVGNPHLETLVPCQD